MNTLYIIDGTTTWGPPVRRPPVGQISLQACFEIWFFYYTVSCSAIFIKVSSKTV